jgi:hypothetical protein
VIASCWSMHAKKSVHAAPNVSGLLPTVICHTEGRRLSGLLAHELTTEGFHLATASDVGAAREHAVDVLLLERDHVDAQGVIDDVRQYFPAARVISLVTIGAVTIVHSFVSVPRATDLESLRLLAASVRRAARRATMAAAGDRLSA